MANFVNLGTYIINLDNVAYIETGTESAAFYAKAHFLGAIPPIRFDGQGAKKLLESVGAIASEPVIGVPTFLPPKIPAKD